MSLAITRAVMPVACVGSWYQARLTHNGAGLSPYTWSVVRDTSLPVGLQLSPSGLVFGVPSAVTPEPYSFLAQVADGGLQRVQALVWFSVVPAFSPTPDNPFQQFVNADFAEGA